MHAQIVKFTNQEPPLLEPLNGANSYDETTFDFNY